jgi:hypothetical protein
MINRPLIMEVKGCKRNWFKGTKMNYQIAHLDSRKRLLEKQESRDRDAARLASGAVSALDLRRENGFFSALPLHRFKMVAIGGKAIAHS